MGDLKLILSSKRKTFFLAIVIWYLIQAAPMCIYFLLADKALSEVIGNLTSAMNLVIVILVPYWVTKIAANRKIRSSTTPFWLLGVMTNALLLIVSLPFSIIGFLINLIINGKEYLLAYGIIILIGTLIGVIFILILGAFSAILAGSRKGKLVS